MNFTIPLLATCVAILIIAFSLSDHEKRIKQLELKP